MDRVAVVPHRDRPVPPGHLRRLYADLGWWPERTEEAIAVMLAGTIAVGAWHEDELVGFARAVTDGLFRAYLEDVAVHADHRQQGIGSRLVTRLVQELADVELTSLFCQPDLAAFYGPLGFRPTKQIVLHHRPDPPS
ncbi:MAG: GNAT family N-acetyltransferase [Chloroflexota bacterium]|nr:GNAT family N-acetyltransferase [Chloroflexota bacterium]